MTFSVHVYDRDGNPVIVPAGLMLQPEKWEAAAVGGPVAADIAVMGSVDDMLSLVAWLAYRVEIVSDGHVIWWGEIDSVSVLAGGIERTATVDGMVNRVKVLYTSSVAGGGVAAAETDWSEDATSIDRYGKREMIHSARGTLTAEQATALRDRLLTLGGNPQKQLQFASGNEVAGSLVCRGHWARLGDVYYQQTDGLEEHNPGSGTAIPLGLGFSSMYLGFIDAGSKKLMSEATGALLKFAEYAGLKIVVTGTSLNNGTRTVESGDGRDAIVYESSQISFGADDDLYDGAQGLAFIATDDMIFVSGAAHVPNNGARRVKTTGISHIEVSPGWNSGFMDSGGSGPTITLWRGNSVTMTEDVTNEAPNATTVETVAAYGQRVYQALALAMDTTWTLAAVEVRVRKVGNPTDALRVGLYTDSSGTPGTLLEQATIDGADLTDEIAWVAFDFANTTALAYGSTYGLLIDRTGAMNANDFYEVEIEPAASYPRGGMRLYDGAAWQSTVPGSLIFRCLGAVDTATQLQSVLTGAGIDGISSALIEDGNSGLEAWQYRADDETAGAIVEDLLAMGTATGARLLATVTAGGLARIFVQPDITSRLWVWRRGTLQAATGAPALPGWLPVGVWVHIDDALLTGAWSNLSPMFVERARYQAGKGWELEAENQQDLRNLLGVAQG